MIDAARPLGPARAVGVALVEAAAAAAVIEDPVKRKMVARSAWARNGAPASSLALDSGRPALLGLFPWAITLLSVTSDLPLRGGGAFKLMKTTEDNALAWAAFALPLMVVLQKVITVDSAFFIFLCLPCRHTMAFDVGALITHLFGHKVRSLNAVEQALPNLRDTLQKFSLDPQNYNRGQLFLFLRSVITCFTGASHMLNMAKHLLMLEKHATRVVAVQASDDVPAVDPQTAAAAANLLYELLVQGIPISILDDVHSDSSLGQQLRNASHVFVGSVLPKSTQLLTYTSFLLADELAKQAVRISLTEGNIESAKFSLLHDVGSLHRRHFLVIIIRFFQHQNSTYNGPILRLRHEVLALKCFDVAVRSAELATAVVDTLQRRIRTTSLRQTHANLVAIHTDNCAAAKASVEDTDTLINNQHLDLPPKTTLRGPCLAHMYNLADGDKSPLSPEVLKCFRSNYVEFLSDKAGQGVVMAALRAMAIDLPNVARLKAFVPADMHALIGNHHTFFYSFSVVRWHSFNDMLWCAFLNLMLPAEVKNDHEIDLNTIPFYVMLRDMDSDKSSKTALMDLFTRAEGSGGWAGLVDLLMTMAVQLEMFFETRIETAVSEGEDLLVVLAAQRFDSMVTKWRGRQQALTESGRREGFKMGEHWPLVTSVANILFRATSLVAKTPKGVEELALRYAKRANEALSSLLAPNGLQRHITPFLPVLRAAALILPSNLAVLGRSVGGLDAVANAVEAAFPKEFNLEEIKKDVLVVLHQNDLTPFRKADAPRKKLHELNDEDDLLLWYQIGAVGAALRRTEFFKFVLRVCLLSSSTAVVERMFAVLAHINDKRKSNTLLDRLYIAMEGRMAAGGTYPVCQPTARVPYYL